MILFKKRIKHQKTVKEQGRSLVEMLGVLALIGILSIGGISGYRYAMEKYRANETLADLNVRSVIYAQKMQNLKEIHTEVELTDAAGEYLKTGFPIQAIGYPDYFEIRLGDVPARVCQRIQDEQWKRPFETTVTQNAQGACDEIQFKFYNSLDGSKTECLSGQLADLNGKCYDPFDKENCTNEKFCNGNIQSPYPSQGASYSPTYGCSCYECAPGYYGKRCEKYDPDVCKGGRWYNMPGQPSSCDCGASYVGIYCEKEENNQEYCNNNGIYFYGQCSCLAGYYGERCETTEPEDIPCINGDIIYENGKPKCLCDYNSYGETCSKSCSEEMKNCSNYHGKGVYDTKAGKCICECSEGYTGTYCETKK